MDRQFPSIASLLEWLDWLDTVRVCSHSYLTLSPTCIISCHGCGESATPPPPPATPPSVIAACLLKRHVDGKLLDWKVILNALPDQVCVKFVSLFIHYYNHAIYKAVFILVDFAVRLMVTSPPVNNHLIDLVKV